RAVAPSHPVRRVDFPLGGEPAATAAQRAWCDLVAAPQREQAIRRRLRRPGASRAGRYRNVAERVQQALSLHAVEAHVEHAAHAALGMPVELDAIERRQTRPETLAQACNPCD